jgi:hypothetical protein
MMYQKIAIILVYAVDMIVLQVFYLRSFMYINIYIYIYKCIYVYTDMTIVLTALYAVDLILIDVIVICFGIIIISYKLLIAIIVTELDYDSIMKIVIYL